MRYEFWLSMKYLLHKRRERLISVISLLAISGIAIGVMALLVVLSVMSGFDYDLKEKLVGANAHLIVEAADGQGLREIDPLMRAVAGSEHVVGGAPFISGQAIVRLPDRAFGVSIRGIDLERETRVTKLKDYLIMGHFPKEQDEALVGSELAGFIGAGPGDHLSLISPATGKTHEITISGLFRSGMYEYDSGLIGLTMAKAQQLFDLKDVVNGLAVRLDAVERAESVKATLRARLGHAYRIRTWTELNQTLFDALKLEKMVMFVILTLIVLVAAANIVATLIMSVIEKTKDIGILKAIGATNRSVRLIFTWQGLLIGATGALLGLGGAWAIVWALDRYQFIHLPSSIYYLDHLPVRIEPSDWWAVTLAAVAISWLSTIYPARQAARLAPVDALRYE